MVMVKRRRSDNLLERVRQRKHRRKRARRILFFSLAAVVFVAAIFFFRTNRLLVTQIEVGGLEPDGRASVVGFVKERLVGNHFFFLPRRHLLLLSTGDLGRELLNHFPALATADVRRNGLTALLINASRRQADFVWCVESGLDCYSMDREGIIFAPAPRFGGAALLEFRGPLSKSPLGKRPIPSAEWQFVVTLKEELATLWQETPGWAANPIRVEQKEGGDYYFWFSPTADSDSEFYVLANREQEVKELVLFLRSALVSEVLVRPQYIDLRFIPKIFYRLYN